MTEQDKPAKPAFDADNPDPPKGPEGHKGLGTETGAEGGPGAAGQDVTKRMPEARGEVRYPDHEDPDSKRPSIAPHEGHVQKDPDTSHDASKGAKD